MMTWKEALEQVRECQGFARRRLAWRLRDQIRDPRAARVVADLLELVGVHVDAGVIDAPVQDERWTPLQIAMAVEWATMLHFRASDNAFVRVPPKPEFLNLRCEKSGAEGPRPWRESKPAQPAPQTSRNATGTIFDLFAPC